MPGLKLTDPGGLKMLDVYFASGAFTVELFTGPTPPPALSDTDTGDAGLIAAGVGSGYVTKTLVPVAASLVGGIPTKTWDPVVWTFTGPLDNTDPIVQGYWVFDAANVLIFEQLVTPFTPTAGDVYTLNLVYKAGNIGSATAPS
jgi:hypothetical protein